MIRRGYYINGKSLSSYGYGTNASTNYDINRGEADFRKALSNQIHQLTGNKPRVEKDGDGWAIYES